MNEKTEQMIIPFEYKERSILPIEKRVLEHLPEAKMLTLVAPDHDDPEWHALRRQGIGSSDAPAIVGLSPFSNSLRIWNDKLGRESEDFIPREYAEFGSWFEPYVIDYIAKRDEVEMFPGSEIGALSWNFWSIAQANIDAYNITDGLIEEIKTSREEWKDGVPLHYQIQVQHQLMVTGAEKARIHQFYCPIDRKYVVHLLKKKRQLETDGAAIFESMIVEWLFEEGGVATHEIRRDDDLIEKLYKKEVQFWNHVINQTNPDVGLEMELTVDMKDDEELIQLFEKFYQSKEDLSSFDQLKKENDAYKTELKDLLTFKTSLLDEKPKKIVCGAYSATFVETKRGSYWRV